MRAPKVSSAVVESSKSQFPPCNACKPSSLNSCQMASRRGICAALQALADSFSIRRWRCKKPPLRRAASLPAISRWASGSLSGEIALKLLGLLTPLAIRWHLRSSSLRMPTKTSFQRERPSRALNEKGVGESFRYFDPAQFKLDACNRRIFLPKLGWMRLRLSREVLGVLKNATVSLSAGKWYVSLQTEREVDQPVPQATTAIGIDMGITRFATFSDGTFIAPINSFKRHEIRLKRYQRSMSRKVKFSKNWIKAKRRVQATHARIGNARRDYLHKATSTISQNHAMVCIEDLQVRNMSRSAAGDIEKPGKNVRAKSGLNKAILDQGWFEFRRQLEYKLNWSGGLLIAVPPHNTSRTCPACGLVAANNRLSQAKFACMSCGYEDNADVVGAINVLARGHRVAACGEDGSGSGRKTGTKPASTKQEPTEATTQGVSHA